MSNFEWRTDDNFSWEETQKQPPNRPRVPRWLRFVPLLVIALALVGWMVWRGVQQRVQTATEQAAANAEASARLLVQSAENQDNELVNNLLSIAQQWFITRQIEAAGASAS